MPWIRTVFLGDDDVIVQVKRWWLPSIFGSMAWYNKTKLSAARNSVEKEIDDAITKIEKLLEKRQQMEEDLAAEVYEVRQSIHSGFGEGNPYYIADKQLNEWAKPHVKRPDVESWHTFFHPLVLREYGFFSKSSRKKNNQHHNQAVSNRPEKGNAPFLRNDQAVSDGNTTTYTVSGLGKTLEPSVDNQVIEFREEKKKDSSNHNEHRDKMKQVRKDNPKESWESDKEYHERMVAMSKN